MRSIFTLVSLCALLACVHAQSPFVQPFEKTEQSDNYAPYFMEAYQLYPNVPQGILEAIAFNRTHIRHVYPDQEAPSCMGLPAQYGVMGLVLDGHGYFNNNLTYIAENTAYTVEQIKDSARYNILAYAEAYQKTLLLLQINQTNIEAQIPVLIYLSELPKVSTPSEMLQNNFAIQTQIYGLLDFLNQSKYQEKYNFPSRNIDLQAIFGIQNYKVLSATRILIYESSIESSEGDQFDGNRSLMVDYPLALWVPAAACNYSSRNGTPVSAVTIHTIQGSYAGAIAWFQNCAASVSAHYVIRSSDGQVTQMVMEADKAWHVGTENPYTIGFEHEGFVDDPSWYTNAMYESSADIVRDIVNSGYGLNPLRSYHGPSCGGSSSTCQLGGCIKVKGHQHYPNQTHTDPGINWDWVKYYNLINNSTPITVETSNTGTACDSGGAGANYGDDERSLLEISPPGALSITLDFSEFDLETDWDFLTIYEGNTIDDPIVGTYTGTAGPGLTTINNPSVLIEFRSDCATTNPGYCFSWSEDVVAPISVVGTIPDPVDADFSVAFSDTDNYGGSGVNDNYFLVADFDGTEWRSNSDHGFYYDDFSNGLHSDWSVYAGAWSVAGGELMQTDVNNENSNIYAAVDQNLADDYLYHWKGMISGLGMNQRAGLHFFCDDAAFANRNNSYFMYFRESSDLLQLYKVVNDVWTLEVDLPYTFNLDQYYDFKIFFNKVSGQIDIYVDDLKALSWTDTSPHTVGNYVSFRSGGCTYTVDDFRVQKGRTTTETITVGNALTNMVRYENPNPATPAGSIRTIIRDYACNLSSEVVEFFNVDWTPLPVELLDFYAKPKHDFIQLEWRTLSEENLWAFILERSDNGSSFNEIAQVNAHDSNLSEFKYEYPDHEVENNRSYYYRLKMIDQDESFEYSPVVIGRLEGPGNTLVAYPNPTSEVMGLKIVSKHSESWFIEVFNSVGQQVTSQELSLPEGQHVLTMPVNNWPDGIYLVRATEKYANVGHAIRLVVKK